MSRLICCMACFFFQFVFAGTLLAAVLEGIRPADAKGRPLNLDFEEGTLKDWTVAGEAFQSQPIKGDTVSVRRNMVSGHQGQYWIGTYEIGGDDPQGTLTSVPFTVTHPFASFLVSGGAWANTRVELVRADTQQVFFKASGYESETLRRVVVDLRPHLGSEMFLRVVDEQSGHWGHINFDNFKFHPSNPTLSAFLLGEGIPQYSSRFWQTDDGLPQNSVQAIAQTGDGYLWVGTQEGLARFDGARFTLFDSPVIPEMKSQSITALCESRDGSFWIGTGSGLFHLREGQFSHYTRTNGFGSDGVKALCEARDGSLWIGTANGLFRYQNGRFSHFTKKDGLVNDVVRVIYEDREGTLWIGTGEGLTRFKDGILSSFEIENGLPQQSIMAICQDRAGNLWIGLHGGLTLLKNGKVTHYTLKDGLLDNIVSALYEDTKGNLWIGTFGGINRMVDGKLRAEHNQQGASYDRVYSFFEDQEENLWVGTKGGLYKLNVLQFSAYSRQQGLSHNTTVSVYEDNRGVLWIGTWGGGLNRWEQGISIDSPTDHSSGLILAIHGDREGSLWVGTDYDGGLHRLKNGLWTGYGKAEGLVDHALAVIHGDKQGNLWIGARDALVRFKNNQFTRFTSRDGLAANKVNAICEDQEGDLWFGTSGGLSRWKDGKFTNYTTREGLSHNTISALYEDREGTLWIGTRGGGLNRFQVQSLKFKAQNHGARDEQERVRSTLNMEHGTWNFTAYTTRDGLFNDSIYEILEDEQGFLWMSSPRGIFRVTKKQLNDFAQGKIGSITSVSYGKADGLPSTECIGVAKPAGWKSRDGRLWFPTAKGLVVVDPHIKVNERPPPVVIEEVISDKKVQSLKFRVQSRSNDATASTLNLEPGKGELEIHYTALSFQAPEKNRFKYKLEGIDSDWVEAGTRRIAYYNYISPGDYTFRVQGCNNDGVWNSLGSSIKLSLQPHFWQTWWFRGVMGFVAIGFVGGIARHVTRQKMQRKLELFEQQHAVEKERLRISEDIHDDVGSRLTEILLLSGIARKQKANAEAMDSFFGKISGAAQEVIDNLHGIVWAVNPRNDSLEKLAEYISEYAQSFLELSSIRCRFDVPDDLPDCPLSSEARHNVFLVVKETLNNVVKHSGCSGVFLQIRVEGAKLSLTIQDNGRGFDALASSSSAGNGLMNMSKRMTDVGGEFRLHSEPGKGTRIRLQIPLRSAGVMEN